MAYELYAIIGTVAHLKRLCPSALNVVPLPLEPRLGIIPLVEERVKATQWPAAGEAPRLENAALLSPGIHRWLLDASSDALVGYIEAEYFGGMGVQHAWGWLKGQLVYPAGEQSDVNGLLALLGVTRKPPDDEWDAVGLGRFRRTEKWLP